MLSVYFCARTGTISVEDANLLWELGYYGTKDNSNYPSLSPVETAYLLERGEVQVFSVELDTILGDLTYESFIGHFKNDRFISLLNLYKQLRGYPGVEAVRSGINYGCEYLVYHDSPDLVHAPLCVLLVDQSIAWRMLLGINRTVSGAKKRLILAIRDKPSTFKLVELERWQPEEVFAGKRMSQLKRDRKLRDELSDLKL